MSARGSRVPTERVPGLARVVVRAGGRAEVDVQGLADLATGEALTTDTPLRWYSLTKPVVAAAVLRAAEQRRIALDEPIAGQLPAWDGALSARHAVVTPRAMLAHAAGLRDRQLHAAAWFREPEVPRPDGDVALRGLLRRHRRLARAGARYSNLGYVALGALLEHVHGAPLEALLRTELLEPWGASRTTLGAARDAPLARGHLRRRGSMALLLRLLTGRRFFDGRAGAHALMRRRELMHPAHGGLVGPIDDLGRVLHGLLTGAGAPGEVERLSADARALQCTPHSRYARRDGECPTLGFFHLDAAPESPREPVLFHGGRGPGFTAEMRLLPERGVAVGLVGNADFDARGAAVALLREALTRDA